MSWFVESGAESHGMHACLVAARPESRSESIDVPVCYWMLKTIGRAASQRYLN